jgi:hypothetical protein
MVQTPDIILLAVYSLVMVSVLLVAVIIHAVSIKMDMQARFNMMV